MSAIAERAGVGMGSLYRRYATKEELLQRLCADSMEHLAEAARAGPGDRRPLAGPRPLHHRVHQLRLRRTGPAGRNHRTHPANPARRRTGPPVHRRPDHPRSQRRRPAHRRDPPGHLPTHRPVQPPRPGPLPGYRATRPFPPTSNRRGRPESHQHHPTTSPTPQPPRVPSHVGHQPDLTAPTTRNRPHTGRGNSTVAPPRPAAPTRPQPLPKADRPLPAPDRPLPAPDRAVSAPNMPSRYWPTPPATPTPNRPDRTERSAPDDSGADHTHPCTAARDQHQRRALHPSNGGSARPGPTTATRLVSQAPPTSIRGAAAGRQRNRRPVHPRSVVARGHAFGEPAVRRVISRFASLVMVADARRHHRPGGDPGPGGVTGARRHPPRPRTVPKPLPAVQARLATRLAPRPPAAQIASQASVGSLEAAPAARRARGW
ncbi:TetR family transcriptional regulator [Actinomadura madurae]|nr:helix-turn-helix domain-containing protein [Actinomadura madurae]MCQ0006884.1 TetR family transcriptional regulator [Actinomadura madurae]